MSDIVFDDMIEDDPSDTPLCNQCFEEAQDFSKSALVVPLEAARQLERKNNELRQALTGRTVSCSRCNEVFKPCDWKQDEGGNWDTQCGQCMCFDYAPPNDQGYKFCHHCGHPINFITFIESLV